MMLVWQLHAEVCDDAYWVQALADNAWRSEDHGGYGASVAVYF